MCNADVNYTRKCAQSRVFFFFFVFSTAAALLPIGAADTSLFFNVAAENREKKGRAHIVGRIKDLLGAALCV